MERAGDGLRMGSVILIDGPPDEAPRSCDGAPQPLVAGVTHSELEQETLIEVYQYLELLAEK